MAEERRGPCSCGGAPRPAGAEVPDVFAHVGSEAGATRAAEFRVFGCVQLARPKPFAGQRGRGRSELCPGRVWEPCVPCEWAAERSQEGALEGARGRPSPSRRAQQRRCTIQALSLAEWTRRT